MNINLEEIKKKYHISTDDLKEIESELLEKIKIHHPDNNFNRTDDYSVGLTNALNYIRNLQKKKREGQTLMQNKDLIKYKEDIIPVQEVIKIEVLSEKLEDNVETQKIMIKKRGDKYGWGSIIFILLLSFLWTLPKEMESNPAFKLIIKRNFNEDTVLVVSYGWIFLIILIFAICIVKFLWDKWYFKKIENLKYETKQNEIFDSFYYATIARNFQFSKTDFIYFIYFKLFKGTDDYNGDLYRKFMKKREKKENRYDWRALKKYEDKNKERIEHKILKYEELLQTAADIILLKAQEHRLIKKIKSDDLIDRYMMVERKNKYNL